MIVLIWEDLILLNDKVWREKIINKRAQSFIWPFKALKWSSIYTYFLYQQHMQGQIENAGNSQFEPPLKLKIAFFGLYRDVGMSFLNKIKKKFCF